MARAAPDDYGVPCFHQKDSGSAPHDPPEEFHALADVVVRAVAFEGDHAVPAGLLEVVQAFADVVRVDAAADGHLAARDARILAAHGGGQPGAHVLDVAVGDPGAQGLQVLQRVVPGDRDNHHYFPSEQSSLLTRKIYCRKMRADISYRCPPTTGIRNKIYSPGPRYLKMKAE